MLGLLAGDAPVSEAACARAGDVMHVLLAIEDEPQLAEKVILGVEAVSLAGGEAAVEARARIGVRWVGRPARDEKGAWSVEVFKPSAPAVKLTFLAFPALSAFLIKVVELWTDLQFIKFSLVAKHTCASHTLLEPSFGQS